MTTGRLRSRTLVSLAVLLLIAVSRWPLAPKYLYWFDSVNFALALDEFNPALHQPQPPGYTLFVGLTWLVHLLVANPQHVLLVTGILASAAAVLLLWVLGRRMFGPAAGLLAAALLIANPCFWFGGITNQVRVFLALDGTVVALLAWRAVERGSSTMPFYAAWAALGIAAGFRPAEAVLLLPLLLWTWARTHRPLRQLLAGLVFLGVSAAPWMIATGVVTGESVNWSELLWRYSREQFQGSSAAFGAGTWAAVVMFAKAVVWNGLGVLTWIWAVPFGKVRRIDPDVRPQVEFLGAWFLPGFLFSALIHIGDPDQALGTIPVLCLAGGAFLYRFAECRRSTPVRSIAAVVVALNAVLFFFPPGRLAKASSYRAVRTVDRVVKATVDSIQEVRGAAPLAIIYYRSPISWRQLEYYFPKDALFVVSPEGQTGEPWLFRNRKRQLLERSDGAIALPGGSRIVCTLAGGRRGPDVLAPAEGWIQHGSVIYSDAIPGGGVLRIGDRWIFKSKNLSTP